MNPPKPSVDKGWLERFVEHPGESAAEQLRRRYLLRAGAQLGLGALAWAAVCVLVGRPEIALIPTAHLFITGLTLLAVTRRSMRVRQGLLVFMASGVVLPWAFQIAGGGFVATGGVMTWSLVSLVGATHLLERPRSQSVIGLFLGLAVLAGILETILPSSDAALLSGLYTPMAFTLNLIGSALGLITLAGWLRADRERVQGALAAANQMEVNFLSTVSHEMRTPLTSILGFTEIIRKKLDKTVFPAVGESTPKVDRAVAQVRGNLRVMTSEGRRLTDLVDTVLDLHLMESGAITWRKQTVQVEDLIGHAAAMCSILMMDRPSIVYEQHIAPDIEAIEGDSDRLVQVIVNLLTNAIKFTEEGTVGLRAEPYERGAESGVEVSISDNGPGIRPEDREAVFRHFRQVGEADEKIAGSGLGLSIAKKIVEGHGGRIWVEGEPGEGATFIFRLPRP